MADKMDTSMKKLEKKLIKEENLDEINEIVNLFNINLQKKNIIRSAKLSEVQDKVVEVMADRISSNPYAIEDADLIKYHKVIQDTLDKTDTSMDSIKAPSIQINQQVNVDKMFFDSESRKRILSAVNDVLNGAVSVDELEMQEEE